MIGGENTKEKNAKNARPTTTLGGLTIELSLLLQLW